MPLVLYFMGMQAQSADYFVNLALENHPEIKAKELQLQSSQTREQQAVSFQDPMLSAGYNVVPNSMEKFNVSLMQNFSWFGTAKFQKEAANKAALSQEYDLTVVKKQKEVEVYALYFQLQEIEQLLELQQQNSEMFSRFEELANNRLSAARGSMVDVIRAELAKENAQLEIELLEQKQKAFKKNLNILTGRNPEEKITIEYETYHPIVIESEIQEHPGIQGINSKISENEALVHAAKKESLPMIGVGIEYMRMEPDRNEFMPMLSISLPVFRKKHKAKIEEAQLLKESYEFEKQWVENQIFRERTRVKTELVQAETELALYTKQIRKSAQAKELLLNYYSTSGDDFQEVLRLQQEELNYKILKTKAEIRALQLAKEWDYLNDTSKL